MGILSIQSHVSRGHVGNSAAVFALQTMGFPVWPVHTVMLSNHPGHATWRGHRVAATDVSEILTGLEETGTFAGCDAVLTGYMGSAETGTAVLDVWARVRAANPETLVLCDPVMGDRSEGLYVTPDLVAHYRDHMVRAADVIVPNAYELQVLAGSTVDSTSSAVDAARRILGQGPEQVIITSLPGDGDTLTNILVDAGGAWAVSTPRLALQAKGAGDFFAALWLANYLGFRDGIAALEKATGAVHALVSAAGDAADELPVVTRANQWLNPDQNFAASPLA